jgi:hypothetical protein
MFYAPEFWFKTFKKTLLEMPDQDEERTCHQAVVIFYQFEAEDVGRENKVISKWVKNAKWLAGKFGTKTVILHSFNHLSQSKGPSEMAFSMVEEVRKRLERANFSVFETPFGYLNEWKMHVSGESLAKVFKEI